MNFFLLNIQLHDLLISLSWTINNYLKNLSRLRRLRTHCWYWIINLCLSVEWKYFKLRVTFGFPRNFSQFISAFWLVIELFYIDYVSYNTLSQFPQPTSAKESQLGWKTFSSHLDPDLCWPGSRGPYILQIYTLSTV